MNLGRIFPFKKTTVLHILGDSHVGELNSISMPRKEVKINTCCVQGATASGIMNPHSKTLAGPIFFEYIKKIQKNDWVMIHLGEVDCGFLIWVRAERQNISVSDQLSATLENYFSLLNAVRQKTGRIIVLSVIPPTIKDGTKFGNVANLRGQISANQRERTDLTFLMNAKLRDYCKKQNIHFMDLDAKIIDVETRLVHEYFLNDNKEDHHLNPVKLKDVISNYLKEILA